MVLNNKRLGIEQHKFCIFFPIHVIANFVLSEVMFGESTVCVCVCVCVYIYIYIYIYQIVFSFKISYCGGTFQIVHNIVII